MPCFRRGDAARSEIAVLVDNALYGQHYIKEALTTLVLRITSGGASVIPGTNVYFLRPDWYPRLGIEMGFTCTIQSQNR